MINAQELRRMNLVSIDGKSFEVDIIFKDRITTTTGHKFFVSDIEPIPLTPEILEKCGFKKDTESQYGGWLSPTFNDEQLRIRKDEFGFYYQANESCSPIYISSLHWLQNFFYFRTGTELTITI